MSTGKNTVPPFMTQGGLVFTPPYTYCIASHLLFDGQVQLAFGTPSEAWSGVFASLYLMQQWPLYSAALYYSSLQPFVCL